MIASKIKFDIDCLDIVIARSCQLNCRGCITFSDHNLVKGYTRIHDSLAWLEFWSQKLRPKTLHLFGGEPLMHPELLEWIKHASNFFKQTIDIQTNGIKVNSLDQKELSDMILKYNVNFSISVHSQEPWYKEKINQAIKKITDIIGVGTWSQTSPYTKYFVGRDNHSLTLNETTSLAWVSHYQGHGDSLAPGNNFDCDKFVESHSYCEAKQFIQLYNGALYKCPPLAVLDDTLSKYNYPNKNIWQPWLDYRPLTVESSDSEIANWLDTQAKPEKYCNMCFGGQGSTIPHKMKVKLVDDHR